jgi:uncharacterized protein
VHKFPSDKIEKAETSQISALTEAADIEVLLVGGGESAEFFSQGVESTLRARNINVEYMNTGAAARTYNVLLTEERKVAVVLIAV